MRRLCLAVVLILASMSAMLSSGGSASAANGACTTSSGVTVVVNFGSLGGGVVVRCAHTSGNGIAALHAAGFSTEGTTQYGGAFVCRLNGKPGVGAEKCTGTPPVDESWRYWYASDGGSWVFSTSGAANRSVVQGGFEGWSFGGGSTPGYSPRRVGSSSGGGSGGSGSSGGSSESSGGAVAPTGPSSAGDRGLPKPKPRSSGADPSSSVSPASPAATGSTAKASNASTKASKADDSGSSRAPWIAGIIIVVLAATAFITHKRRSS